MGVLRHIYLLTCKRMDSRIVHTGRKSRRGWIEILYLFRGKAKIPDIFRKFYCLFHGTSRMGGHEIRDSILLLSCLPVCRIIFLKKLLIDAVTWFSHILQNLIRHMFRCHTQLPTYVMFHQFTQKSLVPVCHHIIKAYTGADEYLLHSRDLPQLPKQRNVIRMIYSQVFAWRGKQALLILADPFRELFLTRWLSEICCGTTHIVNITLELRIICHSGSFFDQRLMTSGLKNSSLMKSQGTEITATKAPSVACQAELDFFQCRNSAQLLIHGMNFLRIRQGIYIIHFLLCQGQSRRILYNISLCPIRFCHWSGAEWICILILNGKAVCINLLIYFYFLIRRKNNRIINSRQIPALKYSSCNIGKFLYRQSTCQRICNLYDRMLTHSIGNHICPGIKEYTVFYFILPIIIMCQSSQAGFNPTQDNGCLFISLTDQIAVHDHRAVRTKSHLASR